MLKVAEAGPLEAILHGTKNVEALGRQSPTQVSDLMRQATFLIMPSIWFEPFGLVLIEALAHGLPVLASRLGSMVDIIEDGKTGLLFEPGNPQDLADKVQWLIEHPAECRRMGENARTVYLANYTPEHNYQQLLAIYGAEMR